MLMLGTRRALLGRRRKGLLSQAAIDALVSWWALDETSGTRYDSHDAHNASAVGSPGYTTGVRGNALSGTTSTNYLNAGDILNFGDQDFCIAVWLKFPATFSTFHTALCRSSGLTSNNRAWGFFRPATDTLQFLVTNASNVTGQPSIAGLPADTWYLVFGAYDAAADLVKIAINNEAWVTGSLAGGPKTTAYNMYFGYTGTSEYPWNGQIDETAAWAGYIPTDNERMALYNNGNGVTYAQAVGA